MAELARRAWVEQIMGLPVSVHVRGAREPGAAVQARVDRFFAELRRVDAVFSLYRVDSDLSRWQRGDLEYQAMDPMVPEVLALCDEAHRRTQGWFDIHDLPHPVTGRPGVDPSGLVKGWAVQRAAAHLAELSDDGLGDDGLGDHGWCVNAGGDILVASPAGHPPWRIGVENPDDPSQVLRVVTLAQGAVATSGTAHRGAHILNPRTRRPAAAVRSVTVTGPSLLWADVYATAAAASDISTMDWLAGLDGYEAFIVRA